MIPMPSTTLRAHDLTDLERTVLSYLLRSAGTLVSKADLTAAVYPAKEPPGSNVLEVIVSRLRRKLAARAIGLKITTQRSRGYRLDPTTMPCAHWDCVQHHLDNGHVECVQEAVA